VRPSVDPVVPAAGVFAEGSIFGVANKEVKAALVEGVGFHAYGFLIGPDVCHVEIDGFAISCMQRGVVLKSRTSNISLKNLKIEHLGTSRYHRAPYPPKRFSDAGAANPTMLTEAILDNTGIPKGEWLNPHVGIDIPALAADVTIEACQFRHFGAFAHGAYGAQPSPEIVGCKLGKKASCGESAHWRHAFIHSHAIYAQGFGITVRDCQFHDITQGHAIKLDGNLVADGRSDGYLATSDVNTPNNAGFGRSSHVIENNCFGPTANPSRSTGHIAFYVNATHVNLGNEETPYLVYFNPPKNVRIMGNTFYAQDADAVGRRSAAPVTVSQFPWYGITGGVVANNATTASRILAVRMPWCDYNGVKDSPLPQCNRIHPGYAPDGGFIFNPDHFGGDLQQLISGTISKPPKATFALLGWPANLLPSKKQSFLLCQNVADSGIDLLVTEGVTHLYAVAHTQDWPLASNWPSSWPPVVAGNQYGKIPAQFSCTVDNAPAIAAPWKPQTGSGMCEPPTTLQRLKAKVVLPPLGEVNGIKLWLKKP